MKNVKIYIYTSIKTLKRNNGAAGYVLSYTTQNNKEATLSKIEYLTNMTNHESELEILSRALSRLNTKDLLIEIYADSLYLENSIYNWIPKWELSDWVTVKGKPVKHAEEWQRILEQLNGNSYCIKRQHHEYSNWLIDQCDRRNRKEDTA